MIKLTYKIDINNYCVNKLLFVSDTFKASCVNITFSWYTIETKPDQKSTCQWIGFFQSTEANVATAVMPKGILKLVSDFQ